MKRRACLLFFAVSLSSVFGAPSAVGLLPQDKAPVEVAGEERNPFGKHVTKGPEAAVETVSEESVVRAVISRLPMGGITRGYGVNKVLLGSFTVEEGEILPDVIPNQTEKVKVLMVSSDKLELGFVDKDGTAEVRKMILSFDLKPVVRFKLGGAPAPASKEGATAFDGVTKKDDSGISR